MKLVRLLFIISSALGLLLITLVGFQRLPLIQAQGGDVDVVKTLNKNSNVVRVGEVLTFTIAVTNNSSFSLTNVTLIDDYDSSVLAYAYGIPAEDQHNPGTATVIWDNVASPPIPPGGSIFITVVFTAEHPKPAVVNAARAEDIVNWENENLITTTGEITQEAVGGAAPLIKNSSSPTATIGLPITFTIVISNDGLALLTELPLSDTYDTQLLEFAYAIPQPDSPIRPGFLFWRDLTTYFGDLDPFEIITVTTVFTPLTEIISTTNQAQTAGAKDKYGNDLAGGQGLVPIIIIDAAPTATPEEPTPAPMPEPTSTPKKDESTPIPQPTATPFPTITPFPTATPTVSNTAMVPRMLPETGSSGDRLSWLLTGGFILIITGWIIWHFQLQKNSKQRDELGL